MKFGIIILNWNNYKDTKRCLESILPSLDNNSLDTEVYLIDNNSDDNSGDRLKKDFLHSLHYYNSGENKGYTGGNNFGIKKAIEDGCDYILILNNDLKIENFTILLKNIDRVFRYDSKIGVLGVNTYNLETKKELKDLGKINKIFMWILGLDNSKIMLDDALSISFRKDVSGCCICFKSKCLKEIGLFDESFFMYAEEQDICLRAIKYDWKVVQMQNKHLKVYRKIDPVSEKQLIWYYGTRNIFCAYKKNLFGLKKYIFMLLQIFVYLRQIIYFIFLHKPKISYEIIRGLKDAFIGGHCKGKSCKKS